MQPRACFFSTGGVILITPPWTPHTRRTHAVATEITSGTHASRSTGVARASHSAIVVPHVAAAHAVVSSPAHAIVHHPWAPSGAIHHARETAAHIPTHARIHASHSPPHAGPTPRIHHRAPSRRGNIPHHDPFLLRFCANLGDRLWPCGLASRNPPASAWQLTVSSHSHCNDTRTPDPIAHLTGHTHTLCSH